MAVPLVLSDLSVSEASNAPLDSESITPSTRPSDYMRTLGAFIRRMRAVGAPVASAATVNIGAITDGEYVHITGITTITAFDTIAAGVKRTLVFDGILTIQHNATTLILPGGVSATTAAGDVYEFTSEGSGNWRCTVFPGQPLDAQLTTLAGITAQQATDLAALSTFIGTLLNDADQGTALTTLGAALNGVLAKSAASSVAAADRGKLLDCTGTFALSPITVATLGAGFVFAVRNSGTGAISVTPVVGQFIDGLPSISFGAGESGFVVCDGAAFKTVGRAGGLGYGQTWQDLTASRAFSPTTFTNSTGKPIMVSVSAQSTGGGGGGAYMSAIVGGVTIARQPTEYYWSSAVVQKEYNISFLVPVDATYSVSVSHASTLGIWAELR